jgi:peptide/nickel transport system permease protein
MLNFLIRRSLVSVFLLFCISLVSFLMITMAPGSPYPWGELNPKITPQVKEMFRKKFHLDRPLYEQYWLNMRDLFTGALRSIKDDRPVSERIAERLPATVLLNIAGHHVVSDIRFADRRLLPRVMLASRWIRSLRSGVFIFIAVPTFWIANLALIGLVKFVGVPVLGTQSYGIAFPNAGSVLA